MRKKEPLHLMIKFIKLDAAAQAPYRATSGAACFDLTATSRTPVYENGVRYTRYGTGLAMEIPEGYCALLFPRSSSVKRGMLLANCVGVVDSDYRGEITACFYAKYATAEGNEYKPGERIIQLMIVPTIEVEFVRAPALTATERGSGGYGSTGK